MVSIKDVARAAGVSLGTVSNVLNRPDSVSQQLRERVTSAIGELGYVRNESARQLRAGASRTIAVVVLDVANPFFADVISGVEAAAEEVGALVIICNSAGDPAREQRHLVRLQEQRVMGVLLSPVRNEPRAQMAELARRGSPVVLVDHVSTAVGCSSVAVDDEYGGALVGAHLLERGHRHIAFIGGPRSVAQVRDRLAGLRSAVAARAQVRIVDTEDMSLRAGSQAAGRLLTGWQEQLDRPTAAFCANDLVAMGVLNECLRRDVKVPAELAIVGYDDIDFAATAAVPLSSVRQPREQLGRTAVELLLERVAAARETGTRGAGAGGGGARGGGGRARRVQFAPELVVRDSSRSAH